MNILALTDLRGQIEYAERLAVEAQGGTVILRGRVRSRAERAEAWRVAWRAPGVTSIENLIEVIR